MDNKVPILSRPKDRSLEAYKVWIQEIVIWLKGHSDNSMTDEMWMTRWKNFWSKVDEKGE